MHRSEAYQAPIAISKGISSLAFLEPGHRRYVMHWNHNITFHLEEIQD